MTSRILTVLTAAVLIASCQPKEEATAPASFTFSVEQDAGFTNLPALQSFVLATDGDDWLIFGGRTNGFHGFGSSQNFPFKKANYNIFVYNTKDKTLDSIPTSMLPAALRSQYSSTNMQARQVGNKLYVCGGYGQNNAGMPDSAWVTYNTISRIDVKKMIQAVRAKDSAKLAASIAYVSDDIVKSTGGELYQMPDGRFYLCLGHIFQGLYTSDSGATGNPFVQQYLDSVHVFKLKETGNSIAFDGPFSYISDGLNDSVTQFHRRDLVVVPGVNKDKSFGISIFGGVFTYRSDNPFGNPIYIAANNTQSYTIDSNFNQQDNIYSAPSFVLYDDAMDRVYTTIFGGLGNDSAIQDNAAFTTLISTICRDNKALTTNLAYNPNPLPAMVGAEGAFIHEKGTPRYKGNNLEVIDYRKLKAGEKQLVGYIYGGILSNAPEWGDPSNPTRPSSNVYKVFITLAK
ncbi:MAG: hypothetical protein EOP56_15640 [Sphingobacteriales bacterium]|nr:MAG: hypothetical protein EOP56_15640 [Sphingobacteriales bacterium]